jgi:GNAT superfamily N-acetyltransferase
MSDVAAAAVHIRPALPQDVHDLLRLIRELAEYERKLPEVAATHADLERWLFGDDPAAEALIALDGDRAIGYAIFYRTFSTFKAQPKMYLEDVYVNPAFRGRGVGERLMQAVAKRAVERHCVRLEWSARPALLPGAERQADHRLALLRPRRPNAARPRHARLNLTRSASRHTRSPRTPAPCDAC